MSWVWDQISLIWALYSCVYIHTCSHTHISLETWCISSLLYARHCAVWNGLAQSIFKMILWSKANLVPFLCVCVLVAQWCLTLCHPIDCGPHVTHQAPLLMVFSRKEHWSGLPFPSPGDLPWTRDWTWVSCMAGRFFTDWTTKEALFYNKNKQKN